MGLVSWFLKISTLNQANLLLVSSRNQSAHGATVRTNNATESSAKPTRLIDDCHFMTPSVWPQSDAQMTTSGDFESIDGSQHAMQCALCDKQGATVSAT